jgi:hypothetical protein
MARQALFATLLVTTLGLGACGAPAEDAPADELVGADGKADGRAIDSLTSVVLQYLSWIVDLQTSLATRELTALIAARLESGHEVRAGAIHAHTYTTYPEGVTP